MENNWIVSAVGGGTSGMVIGVVYIIYKCIKKSSCRSNCCGIKSSLSIDLEKGLNSEKSLEGFQEK
jgi:hypothetical protein